MLLAGINLSKVSVQRQITRNITKNVANRVGEMPGSSDTGETNGTGESKRIQEFRKKLKLDPIPRVSPGMRFIDLMLVTTNSKTGELISDAEKEPTKWGDWQHGGRVSDF